MNSPTPLGVAERVGKNYERSRASWFEEDFTGHRIAVCLSHGRRSVTNEKKSSFTVRDVKIYHSMRLCHIFRNKKKKKGKRNGKGTKKVNSKRIIKKRDDTGY